MAEDKTSPEAAEPQRKREEPTPLEQLERDWHGAKRIAGSLMAFLRRHGSMQIWRELFSARNIFDWNFVGYAAALFIAGGTAMLELPSLFGPQTPLYAEVFFIVAAIIFLAKIVQIAVTINYPFWERAMFTFVISGLVGVGVVELIRAIEKNRPAAKSADAASAASSVTPPPPVPPTLQDLFRTDFPNMLKGRVGFPITAKDGTVVEVEAQLYTDFEGRSMFVGFYVPSNPQPYQACAYLADHTDVALALAKNVPKGGRAGEITPSTDLTFSRRVYIYHQDELSNIELGSLATLYESRNLAAVFRGTQYWLLRTVTATPREETSQGSNQVTPPPTPPERPYVSPKLVIDFASNEEVKYHLQIENIGKAPAQNVRLTFEANGAAYIEKDPYLTRFLLPGPKFSIPGSLNMLKPMQYNSLIVKAYYSAEINGSKQDFLTTYRFFLEPENLKPQTIDPEGWEEGKGGDEVIKQAQRDAVFSGLARPQGTIQLSPISEIGDDGKPNIVHVRTESKEFVFDPTLRIVYFHMVAKSGRSINLRLPLKKNENGLHMVAIRWDDEEGGTLNVDGNQFHETGR